ncbi:MAG: hypothetical protein K6C40_00995 [Thermoguttaceae bacterium]|nr:hypothetical protein [Thermoguttaceae bacterium]
MSNKNKYRLFYQSLFVLGLIVGMTGVRASAQNPYDFATANQGSANGFAVPVQATSPFDANAAPAQAGMSGSPMVTSTEVETIDPTVGYGQEIYEYEVEGGTPVYGRGYTTVPDYPRNNQYSPEAAFTPEPPAEYPQTREEMAPELIRRDPALPPYQQQETYSYMTNTTTSSSTACQLCNEGYGNPYLWQIGGGAVVRHHAKQEKSYGMFYVSDSAGVMELNANTTFGISGGLDLSITRYLGRNAFNYDIWADLHFDGLYSWNGSNTYVINQDTQTYSSSAATVFTNTYGTIAGLTSWEETVQTTGDDGTTSSTTYKSVPITQHMDYDIDLNSAELVFQFRKRGRPDPLIGHPNGTWTRECQGGLRYTHMFGLSYINYRETMNWSGYSNVFTNTDGAGYTFAGTEEGYVYNKTTNNMVGAVIGGEFEDKHCVWAWGMKWRFNPYLNIEKSTTSVSDGYVSSIDNTGIAYQGTWGIFATLKTGNHIKWRLGYDVSVLGGTATCARNTSYSPNDAICDSSYNILQSLTLKCTAVW